MKSENKETLTTRKISIGKNANATIFYSRSFLWKFCIFEISSTIRNNLVKFTEPHALQKGWYTYQINVLFKGSVEVRSKRKLTDCMRILSGDNENPGSDYPRAMYSTVRLHLTATTWYFRLSRPPRASERDWQRGEQQ